MKYLFFLTLLSTLLLFGCSKDLLETDYPIENEVTLSDGDDLSLRSGNPDDPNPLTQFPIINLGEQNQIIASRFIGDSYCYEGSAVAGKIGFEVDLELNIKSSSITNGNTKVIVDKITIKGAKATYGTPFISI